MVRERKINIKIDNAKASVSTREIQVGFEEISRTLLNLTSGIAEQFSEMNLQISSTLKAFFEGLDLSHLSKVRQEHIQNIMSMLQQGWKLDWYLANEIVEVLLDRYETLTEEYHFDEQIVKEYFEKNFDSISNRAINHPFYENHKELLLESKRLFNENSFAISLYPLFSAIDNLFTRYVTKPEQIQIDDNTTYVSGEKKKELKKQKEEKYNPNQTGDISHLTIYSAYVGYLYYFKSSNDRNSLNRNIYMHGNYNYSLMDKDKCLKLWSFLILCIDFIEEMQRLKNDAFQEML